MLAYEQAVSWEVLLGPHVEAMIMTKLYTADQGNKELDLDLGIYQWSSKAEIPSPRGENIYYGLSCFN